MNLKNYFFFPFLFLLFGSIATHAQIPPSVEWSAGFGGTSNDISVGGIRHTADGGYIVAGYANSTDGDVSGPPGGGAWVVKADADGNLEWEGSFSGAEVDDIQQTPDGGYIGTGRAAGLTIGNADFWVFKLNYDGSLAWEETYGGSLQDWPHTIEVTSDGGYIVAGHTESDDGDVGGNEGGEDVWVVKLDADGTLDWEETYGGSLNDRAVSIQQTADGGYVVAGETQSDDGDIGENQGLWDIWVFKIDSDGDLYWEETYGGSAGDGISGGFGYPHDIIHQTPDGGYIVAGATGSIDGDVSNPPSGGVSDVWVLKLDADGSLDWEQTYGGTFPESGGMLEPTLDGNYVVLALTWSNDGDVGENQGINDFWLLKIDPSGTVLWEQTYGGTGQDYPTGLEQVSGCEYVMTGYGGSIDGDIGPGNGGNYWVLKVRIDLEPPPLPPILKTSAGGKAQPSTTWRWRPPTSRISPPPSTGTTTRTTCTRFPAPPL